MVDGQNNFDNLFFRDRIYASPRRGGSVNGELTDMGVLPHWVRTLKCLFKGLQVEVKPDNTFTFTTAPSFKDSKIQRFKEVPACCIHDELMHKVATEKFHLEEKIKVLSRTIAENERCCERNWLLIDRAKDVSMKRSMKGEQWVDYDMMRDLEHFEDDVQAYDDLCDKVSREKVRCEHKVELLEEVLEEFEKFDRCNCFVVKKLVEMDIAEEEGRGAGDGEDRRGWDIEEEEKGFVRRCKQND